MLLSNLRNPSSFFHRVDDVKERTPDLSAVIQIIIIVWATWKCLLEKCQKHNFIDVFKNPSFPKYEASFVVVVVFQVIVLQTSVLMDKVKFLNYLFIYSGIESWVNMK